MAILLTIVIGVLYGASVYLMMRRSIVKLVLGLALLSHAANLLILTAGGLRRAATPIIPAGMEPAQIVITPPTADAGVTNAGDLFVVADPLPQALVLTAIVIGFGLLTFSIVLVLRGYRSLGINDLDHMKATDT